MIKTGAPWFRIAMEELLQGVAEIKGPVHNPRIVEYHRGTTLKAKTDEVPWCSSFVNWCMQRSGTERTDRADARSWLSWGEAIKKPRVGCIVVFKRGLLPWQGHVGFFVGFCGGKVLCLGGNQKNSVNISAYPKNKVLGYRWVE